MKQAQLDTEAKHIMAALIRASQKAKQLAEATHTRFVVTTQNVTLTAPTK